MQDEKTITQDAVDHPDARRVVVRSTGEVFELTGPDEAVQEALVTVDRYLSEIQDARRAISDELIARMDRAASWTVKGPEGTKLSAPSPTAGEKFDEAALAESMKTLVEDGVIEIEAFDRAFVREVKLTMPDRAWQSLAGWVEQGEGRGVKGGAAWKAGKAGVNAIVKVAGDRGAALVRAATIPSATPRKVTVES